MREKEIILGVFFAVALSLWPSPIMAEPLRKIQFQFERNAPIDILRNPSLRSFEKARISPRVVTAWVRNKIGEDGFVIVDIRSANRGYPKSAFKTGHIPGAVSAPYPGRWIMPQSGKTGLLPPIDELEKLAGSLGITIDSTVVIVSAGKSPADVIASTRVFWTLRYLGLEKISILIGGFAAWNKEQPGALEENGEDPQPMKFKARIRSELLATTDEVSEIRTGPTLLIDARSKDYFSGKKRHPQAKRYGRLPRALHLDHMDLIDQKLNQLKNPEAVRSLVKGLLSLKAREIVTYSNTGRSASVDWFVLSEMLGLENVSLYDNSMLGWSERATLPMESDRTILNELRDWAVWPFEFLWLKKK